MLEFSNSSGWKELFGEFCTNSAKLVMLLVGEVSNHCHALSFNVCTRNPIRNDFTITPSYLKLLQIFMKRATWECGFSSTLLHNDMMLENKLITSGQSWTFGWLYNGYILLDWFSTMEGMKMPSKDYHLHLLLDLKLFPLNSVSSTPWNIFKWSIRSNIFP